MADLQVAERVEMRAELHRPRHELGDPVAAGVMRGADERLAEVAAGEHRHALVEHAREVEHPPLAHELERLEALARRDVVEHPELVVGTERRGPPALHRRHRRASRCPRYIAA
jgi:hypothetical protein